MPSRSFLARQLQETAQLMQWAIQRVPQERLLVVPPHGKHPKAAQTLGDYFGTWPAGRLMFHLAYYEESCTRKHT